MNNNQISIMIEIIKNINLQLFRGEAFYNFIEAILTGDSLAVSKASINTMNLLIHIPINLFWSKMERFLYGTFRNYEEQVRMASKFNDDNDKYKEFVKKLIYKIDAIDEDRKVDYFANLTRCFLLTELDGALYFKLTRFLTLCTSEELEYIANFDYEEKRGLTAMISSLYQFGLFEQADIGNGNVQYALSGFARALKINCLNFNEDCAGIPRILTYDQVPPLPILEPVTIDDIDQMFDANLMTSDK